jgi:uncharacterized Zn finger protein (UPF0148 family)
MRCKYCGWDNPAGNAKCSKCNQPLSEEYDYGNRQRETLDDKEFNPRKTVSENATFPKQNPEKTSGKEDTCSRCGYPVMEEATACPACGTQKEIQKEADFGRQTIRPGRRSHCSLTLIPEEKERIRPETFSFSGEEIILNRNNTEQDNPTITSKEQAALTYENRRWYIQDRSELKTTCVQASRKIEIQPGDIIILGDRRFEFDY